MKKIINCTCLATAFLLMLLPVISAVNQSSSNLPGQGPVLTADGGPLPLPPLPPTNA
jgi:hypothetical protein